MEYETLLLSQEDGVATITLNRPDRLNALSRQLMADLDDCITRLDQDNEVRCVILTGAGRGFCAGADIKEMAEETGQRPRFRPRYSVFSKIEDLGQPVIAAINGPCNGGGLELALCCDFRIASEAANMGLGEVKLGVMPLAGGTVRLPRLIGPGLAKEFLYFGNRVDGRQAFQIGLVNKVVPADELMAEAGKWAAELSERAPLSLRMIKRSVNQGQDMDLLGALGHEDRCGTELIHSEDHKEGIMAFVEKRKPQFKGR
ncbi:MAG: enoyl-CoA hydratase [Proteobacteria bacterium]|nr:enoyl-CoA hydratase [Pseudomonadota bacterium]